MKCGLGEVSVGCEPFFSSWSSQNLSQALVPAGVSVKKGQELVNICCPIVISDAGLFNTYEHLLPETARCLPGKTGQRGSPPRFPASPSGASSFSLADASPRVMAALCP